MTVHSLSRWAYARSGGRDGDPALLVRGVGVGAGPEDAHEVAHLARGAGGGLHQGGDPVELGGGEDVEAALLAGRDDQAAGERGAEARREEQPPLVVEPGRVGAQELVHGRHLLDPSHPPGCTGFPHFTPPCSTMSAIRGICGRISQRFRSSEGVVRSGGDCRTAITAPHSRDAGPDPRRPPLGRRLAGPRRAAGGARWSGSASAGWSAVERFGRRSVERRGAGSARRGRAVEGSTREATSGPPVRWAIPYPASVRQDRGHPAP